MGHGLVGGRYRLLEPVGSGGMGRVWLARDEMLKRDVAIKEVIPPSWLTDAERDELRMRTLREAQAAARLSHPHVVQTYDVVHGEARPWIVMEYIPSRSLHRVITEDGPLDPQSVAQIGLCVLAGLRAAHMAGVLHRDVKPHNVLIGHDGRVVLTDFGLATFDTGDGAATRAGLIMGSPQYVSPERARYGASTVESDLWSLGATLYAAVEGRSPYARSSAMATLSALATDPPDPPRRAGPLRAVLNGLLRRDPKARISPAEAHTILLRIATGELRGRQWLLPRQRRTADAGNGAARTVPAPPTPSAPPPPAPPVVALPAAGRPVVGPVPTPPVWIEAVPAGVVDPATITSPPPVIRPPAERPAPEPEPEPTVVRAPTPEPATTRIGDPAPATDRPASHQPVPDQPALDRSAPTPVPAGRSPVSGPPASGSAQGSARSGSHLDEPTTRRIPTSDPPPRLRVIRRDPDRATKRRPSEPPRRNRRGDVLATATMALLVLALAAALLVTAPWQDRRTGAPGAAPNAAAEPSPGGSRSAAPPHVAAGAGAGAVAALACATPPSGSRRLTPLKGATRTAPNKYALFPGWSFHRDADGFGVAVPDGWLYFRAGAIACFRDPDGVRILSVDPSRRPKTDPLQGCITEEKRLTGNGALPEYRRLRMQSVDRFVKGAEWEYTYTSGKTRMQARTVWFVASPTDAYAVGWATREFDWRANQANLDMIIGSFAPATLS